MAFDPPIYHCGRIGPMGGSVTEEGPAVYAGGLT